MSGLKKGQCVSFELLGSRENQSVAWTERKKMTLKDRNIRWGAI